MKEDKKISQEDSHDEGSLDNASYLKASDLQSDSDDIETPSLSIATDRQAVEANIENAVKELTTKPESKYKFIRSIGFGGMKAILQVTDKDTTRKVAMAIVPDFDDRPESDVKRFVREARITARLEHPNIVPIHDIGIDKAGSPYFTMKYLRGESLATYLKKLNQGDPEALTKYNLQRLLRIFVKVSNAIDFAHSKQIIHLDLKPENIHVGSFGEVLVLDWGLAKFIGDEEEITHDSKKKKKKDDNPFLTLDGVAKGTPGYMAPEQAAGKNKEKDQRTDIYGLGCLLYAILTFENPLSNRKDVEKMLHDTVLGNIESPSQLKNPGRSIPSRLESICLKAMNLLPDDRYQSVTELRSDIYAFMGGYATKAENASTIKKTFLFINRNWLPLLFSVTFLTLLVLIALAIFAYKHGFITTNI
jgi:serine/threonine protein kinase